MRTSLHAIWGCGDGPLKRLAPHARLATGALVFATCMVAPAATAAGSLLIGVAVAAWLLVCGMPGRLLGWTFVLGLTLFLPYFLLLPLLPATAASTDGWRTSWLVPWAILLRGVAGMLVSMATVACLDAGDLRTALARLPVPRMVSAILLQIVHQTSTLFHETKRIMAAMAVRGAAGGGIKAWRLLSALPQVWLPRVVMRAERVAAAMELRGYCNDDPRLQATAKTGVSGIAALVLGVAVLALAIALRVGSRA